jgi:hypothetical protein
MFGLRLLFLLAFFFKGFITEFVRGLLHFLNHDYNTDDIVYYQNRKARIVRQGITKTTFHFIDEDRKMIVYNFALPDLKLEKSLKRNGDETTGMTKVKKND